MSSTKDLLDDKQEETKYRIIASEIGISYEELLETDPFTFNITNDDGYVIDSVIEFSYDAPKYILDKIINLNHDTLQCSILFISEKLNFEHEGDNDSMDIGNTNNLNDLF